MGVKWMIKKYKNGIKAAIISIVFLAVMYVLIGFVYSMYLPSEKQFMTDSPSKMLGKELYMGNGSLWEKLEKAGMLGCFWHKESGGLLPNNRIHSVFDISFDENKGVMKVYSIVNEYNENGKLITKTSRANSVDLPDKGNMTDEEYNKLIEEEKAKSSAIGRLAAETARENNAFNVQKALYNAINAKAVVNESAIQAEMDWKDPYIEQSNPASEEEKNKIVYSLILVRFFNYYKIVTD